ncbi:hypothetical protein EST38_g10082 [Candolleomyces aberdarensis]|uniref:Protein kinase domain-containing protein n=1 Tax=Candolleomyces aberdarensis TaxID=2316362 RepID=A0A4Q2DAQ1_9AGAR|nr:hypothetical protein EST38_g10082 [Candolleomyces aberdarensis]
MPLSNAVDPSQTWAVRPQSESLTSPPPLPDLQFRPNGSSNGRSPSYGSLEYSSGDTGDESDTPRPRRVQKSNAQSGESRLAYKPSFSKATFQWMRGELLGQGSYGRVYLALNATTGEIMAVKQVEFPKTASDRIKSHHLDVMKALKFESDTLKDLDHPNIVQYLGFEESEDFLSIFLEYVPGGTISELLRQHGRFREEVTTSFLHQILQGLDYLHSRNILHRDLKADNILVEELGVCKISDFGISKKADDLYRGGRAYTMMKGTVYWMAPEVLSPDGQGYDAKVDIWSLGCVAVEMWTGSRPWSGFLAAPVMMKLFQEKLAPPIPSDTSLSPLANDFRENCFHT